MGCGRPRKPTARTPPAVVHVFIPPSSSLTRTNNSTYRKLDTTTKSPKKPILEAIVEEVIPIETTGTTSREEGEEPEKQLPRVEIIKSNQVPSNRREITYTTPSIVNGEVEVSIENQDIESELQYWENALVMYGIGEDLSMNAVRKFMINMWNFISLPELYYNNKGYFIIRFNSKSGRDVILMREPYTIHRKPMFLHEWKPNFTMKDDMIRTLPL